MEVGNLENRQKHSEKSLGIEPRPFRLEASALTTAPTLLCIPVAAPYNVKHGENDSARLKR